MAGMLLVFLLQCVLLVFLGMPAGLAILLCGMWLLFFLLYFIQDYHRKNRRRKELCAIIDSMEKRYLMHEMLPKGANHEEAFYRRLLYLGNKSMLEEIGTVQRSRREYQDYVEQWVHEIKTPIAAMKLSIENQQGERKRQLFQQLERVEHYVEQVLFYARSESVEKDFRIQQVSLSSCIQEALLQCKYLCTQASMSIRFPEQDALVYTDEKWLIFLLNQLIENAVKYRRKKGAVLSLAIQKDARHVVLTVKDNGLGIPEHDLPRIFDKGFTGDNGRMIHSHSTGIGLYLCKKLCTSLADRSACGFRSGGNRDESGVLPCIKLQNCHIPVRKPPTLTWAYFVYFRERGREVYECCYSFPRGKILWKSGEYHTGIE